MVPSRHCGLHALYAYRGRGLPRLAAHVIAFFTWNFKHGHADWTVCSGAPLLRPAADLTADVKQLDPA